jgi:hypothetical protein
LGDLSLPEESFSSPEFLREMVGEMLPWLELSLKTRRIGLREVLLMRGDERKGATRRSANFGFWVARGSVDGDQAPVLLRFSLANMGLTARTTSNGDSGEFEDALDEREVFSCMRVGLEGERDSDLLSLWIAAAS